MCGGTRFACGMKKPRNGNKRPPASTRPQNGKSDRRDETRFACSRVHSATERRNPLAREIRKSRNGKAAERTWPPLAFLIVLPIHRQRKPRNGRHALPRPPGHSTEKVTGAMNDTPCPRRSTLCVRKIKHRRKRSRRSNHFQRFLRFIFFL